MRAFLALCLRCVLVLGLGFTPVANALNMATMAASQEETPPCHAPIHQPHHADGKGCNTAGQCHCAMAICLPAAVATGTHAAPPSDHPQTAHRLVLGQTFIPETPPPR